ncbi:hypothetical protein ABZV53_46485, partial [Streptomyces sp900116325]
PVAVHLCGHHPDAEANPRIRSNPYTTSLDATGGGSVGFNGSIPGAARLLLVDGVALLRPEEQVFTAMLTGFANQQLARNLARTTVEGRENTVKAFAAYVNTSPGAGHRRWWTSGSVTCAHCVT